MTSGIRRTAPGRQVITFYSYKGGVGRSMALANIGYRLADKHDLRVVVADWDLEAPGLHRYFGIDERRLAHANGVLDYLVDWREAVKAQASVPPDCSEWPIHVTDPDLAPRNGSLALLPAGKLDAAYAKNLHGFNWKTFYKSQGGAACIETFREQLLRDADLLLIDSRRGP